MHTSVRRIALAALALPLLLAGCADDDPVPKIPDASTPTASVAETADPGDPDDPVEPTLPPEAEGKGNEAAEAFVRYYVAVVDFSRQTMEPERIRALSTAGCTGCEGLSQLIQKVNANGGRIAGGDQQIKEVRAEELGVPGDDEAFRATATVRTTEQTIAGSGVEGLDGVRAPESLRYEFVVLRSGSQWRVSEWDVL